MKFFLSLLALGVFYLSSYEGSFVENKIVSAHEGMNPTQRLVKKELELVRIDEKVGDVLDADLTFYNQDGEAVSLNNYLGGNPLVLSFAYYSCTLICQFVLQGQVDVFSKIKMNSGGEFQALTISFDTNDTAELTAKMTEIYTRQTVGENFEWTFLYGKSKEVKSITEQLGFYYNWIEVSEEFAHSAAIYVITPEGKISRYFYGIEYNPFDLQMALIEAKDEKTLSTTERILLYCYQYDSDSRGYALEAKQVMKAGGVVTVMIMGLFFVFANSKRIRLYGKEIINGKK